jgi:glycosyltransferase involved in cell wall biosynthesis
MKGKEIKIINKIETFVKEDQHSRVRVSVCIPTYNSMKFLCPAINSILMQTYKVNDIIILDDCSTDTTLTVANEFMKKYTNRNISIVKNTKNLGYARNWNRCLEVVNTDYCVLLHADDILKSDTVRKQVCFLVDHPECAIVGGQEDYIRENGTLINCAKIKDAKTYQKGQVYEFVSETNSYLPCSSVMFDMTKIRNQFFFDTDVLAADEILWPKILNDFAIGVMGNSLIQRRIHPEQAEYNDFQNKYRQIISACRLHQQRIPKYEKRETEKKKLIKLLKNKYSRSMIVIALKVIEYYNNYPLAVKYILYSITNNPKILLEKFFYKNIAKMYLMLMKIYPQNR